MVKNHENHNTASKNNAQQDRVHITEVKLLNMHMVGSIIPLPARWACNTESSKIDFIWLEIICAYILCLITLRPEETGQHFADDIIKCIYDFSSVKTTVFVIANMRHPASMFYIEDGVVICCWLK